MNNPDRPYVGRSMLRREDHRLLTGQGLFIADLVLPRMLHAVFVRSPIAHARIRSVDISRAAAAPGVALALNGAELSRLLPPLADGPILAPSKWASAVSHEFSNPRQPLLADNKVCHVREALAIIVAESRHQAEDAAELVTWDFEELPAVVDPEAALRHDSTVVHERYHTNQVGSFSVGKGDVDAALTHAPHRLRRRFHHHRYAAVPLECRGAVCAWDRRSNVMTIWATSQTVHRLRGDTAALLQLPEARVRCVALDVGGGFGGKIVSYPEYLLTAFAARAVGRPIRWIEDRREHMTSSTHSRDHTHDVEVGFDNEGHILALRDDYIVDSGAWNPVPLVAYNAAVHLMGPYKIENFATSGRIVITNKVPNAPYRGAGHPEAVFAMERTIDLIARTLGMEPAKVRQNNMIRAEEMPYRVGIPFRDGEAIVYDSGDYPGALEKALDEVGGLTAFRRRQSEARREGRYLGLGIACYTEGTGFGPFESACVRIDPSGQIYVSSGACPQGQGMETIFAQIAADLWKVTPDDVIVSLGDTAAIAVGFGTLASRSTISVSAAVYYASARLREKVFAIAGNLLECATTDLELLDGGVGIVGVPGTAISLARVARAAARGWENLRPAGVEAGLEETYHWQPPTVTWSYGTHVAIVEVDHETGRVEIEDYAIVDDCGSIINPTLATGQIIGGAAQGIGGILLEKIVFDTNGQLLTGSLMDYALPRAGDIPPMRPVHQHYPSPQNPFGVKGVGESGAVGPPAAIANAVSDALAAFAVEVNATPVAPEQLLRAMAG